MNSPTIMRPSKGSFVMTLPPELETRIQQQASRAGLSMEAWLQQQVLRQELEDYTPPGASLQDELTPEEWVRQFHAWAEGHDRMTPLLSDAAISRENIYPDRL
jgi:hypothetical protein